jgi:putative molybdopterin biosynthesis protein
VHVAGAHLREPDGDYNISAAAELLPGGGEVIGFCSWREGLALRPERAGGISGIRDLVEAGLRLVNREPGTEARTRLDRELAGAGIAASQLPGYDTRAAGHLHLAAASPSPRCGAQRSLPTPACSPPCSAKWPTGATSAPR